MEKFVVVTRHPAHSRNHRRARQLITRTHMTGSKRRGGRLSLGVNEPRLVLLVLYPYPYSVMVLLPRRTHDVSLGVRSPALQSMACCRQQSLQAWGIPPALRPTKPGTTRQAKPRHIRSSPRRHGNKPLYILTVLRTDTIRALRCPPTPARVAGRRVSSRSLHQCIAGRLPRTCTAFGIGSGEASPDSQTANRVARQRSRRIGRCLTRGCIDSDVGGSLHWPCSGCVHGLSVPIDRPLFPPRCPLTPLADDPWRPSVLIRWESDGMFGPIHIDQLGPLAHFPQASLTAEQDWSRHPCRGWNGGDEKRRGTKTR
ncbi:hypothetical protein CTA1_9147 [Colletotrichum tanaceti]|uniref:Uncharacterized protein n=1 Tax=Colletotrichum tanaceti TaxID=1306861 RepID=A0A4U6XRG5_9PEZI|nr:hypothetical protein CTA1_9147 [Colletotrichum tanaceti]